MKSLLILLLSISLFSCKEPVNPFIPENITNSESKEEINQDDNSDSQNQNPEEFIKTVISTISLPNCPSNSNFDMIAINFTDGRTEDDLILGENQYCKKSSFKVEIPYPVKVKQFKMSKYMVSYNTWYHVYQWAIKNGYKFIDKGSEGMYANGVDASAYYPFNEGGEPKVEEMPVGSVNWRDAIVWCNALSEMTGLTPVYCSDVNFKTPLRDSTQSTTGFADTNWDMTPGKIDNPYVNTKANGYRLPYTAEWEYAARKKANGTCIEGRNIPGDESGSFYEHTSTDTANGIEFTQSTVFGNYMWFRKNASGECKETASGKDDTNATMQAKLGHKPGNNRTHLSGGKLPSHLGFYDLTGNLTEWMFEYNVQHGSIIKVSAFREVRGTDFLSDTNYKTSGEYGGHFPLQGLGFRICKNN
ncbi:MAG: SUMF1/EgtB/PvdO family nonheme iron enzyme [Treponemataceae bacterium]|nr:SUMF1/EgtB/PvdO family nonheme iron enzyme [Treponemataceae bacterium]